MNFHKTIGFLAALLLMLGVPDSFVHAQTAITLSLNRSRVTEGSSVVVTATLAEAPAAGATVTIPLVITRNPDRLQLYFGS